MKYKESRLPEEISTTSEDVEISHVDEKYQQLSCRWHHPYGRKWKENKEPQWKWKGSMKKLA